jgi:hypothetical protein
MIRTRNSIVILGIAVISEEAMDTMQTTHTYRLS